LQSKLIIAHRERRTKHVTAGGDGEGREEIPFRVEKISSGKGGQREWKGGGSNADTNDRAKTQRCLKTLREDSNGQRLRMETEMEVWHEEHSKR